ncbi:MAG TPA: hypothetical protein VNA17_05010 [Pyrinomonadaceae bacterium]|nr:hypothetical protein [Pyrinomonadaceae bacterium]
MRLHFVAISALIFVISCVTAQTPSGQTEKKDAPTRPAASPAGSQPARLPGMLDGGDDATVVPVSVGAGKDFTVTIKTSGNGCVSQGDTSVIVGESGADIFVYDTTTATGPGTICTMIYKQFEHKATLRFDQKGEGLIRIWARRAGDKTPLGNPVVVEKGIAVK